MYCGGIRPADSVGWRHLIFNSSALLRELELQCLPKVLVSASFQGQTQAFAFPPLNNVDLLLNDVGDKEIGFFLQLL